MTPGQPNQPSQDLRARGQSIMAELAGLLDAMAKEAAGQQAQLAEVTAARQDLLAKLGQATATQQDLQAKLGQAAASQQDLQAKLNQAQHDLQARGQAMQAAEQQWAGERKALQASHQAELKKVNDRLAAMTADNEALQAYQLQWAAEREGHLKARDEAQTRHAELDKQLRSVAEENDNLKELHTRVTAQATSLVTEWSNRRQALAKENERLRSELEQAGKALDATRQREKDWQGQVVKLQDELKRLRETAGRMTLSDDQSHHLLSQLNAIIGFAEVLLDEAGNRATGEERVEFLRDIKDSGAHLADFVNQISAVRETGSSMDEPADQPANPPAAADWTARTVLVVATDAVVRERTQAFLDKAGYRTEFADDAVPAIKLALEHKPLAIVIDTELSGGAQALIDDLQREPRVRDIPVVLTGANSEEPLGLTIDRYDFLTKPINKQQMLQLMVKYDLLADRRRAAKMPTSILVIDDDARNTRLVKAMLKPYAVSVLEANGGAAGIKVAQRSKPELIILDLMMPDVDGFQVVSALRSDPATSQIPILIYTAKNITTEDRQRLQASIQSIVRKGDLSKEQFLELVYKRGERRNAPSAADAAA